jgi:predicted phage terminase large subunit-like protein
VFRQRLEMPKLVERAIYLEERTLPDLIVVETNGIGAALYQSLDAKFGVKRVKGTTSKEDKQIRSERLTTFLATKKVHLPTSAAWFESFWNELSGFPFGAYDDQVDSFIQFLTHRDRILFLARQAGARCAERTKVGKALCYA